MSLPLAIALIVLFDVAVIGTVTFVMTRARLLTPHVSRSALAGAHTPSPRGRPLRPRARASSAGAMRVPAGA
jgi:hypothetical protein